MTNVAEEKAKQLDTIMNQIYSGPSEVEFVNKYYKNMGYKEILFDITMRAAEKRMNTSHVDLSMMASILYKLSHKTMEKGEKKVEGWIN